MEFKFIVAIFFNLQAIGILILVSATVKSVLTYPDDGGQGGDGNNDDGQQWQQRRRATMLQHGLGRRRCLSCFLSFSHCMFGAAREHVAQWSLGLRGGGCVGAAGSCAPAEWVATTERCRRAESARGAQPFERARMAIMLYISRCSLCFLLATAAAAAHELCTEKMIFIKIDRRH